MGCFRTLLLRAVGARVALGVAAGAVLPGVAQAFAPDPESTYATGRTTVQAVATNPNWNPSVSGSGYKISRNFEMAAPAGKKVPVTAYINVPKAGASGARRFMAKALKGLPLIGTGIMLWELWQEFGVRPDGAGGLEIDPGAAPQSVEVWRTSVVGGGTADFPTQVAACQANEAYSNSLGGIYIVQGFAPAGNGCSGYFKRRANPNDPWTFQASGIQNGTFTKTTGFQCPTTGAMLVTGKCRTDEYQPTTEEYAEELIANYPPPSAEELAALKSALTFEPMPVPYSKPYIEGTPNVGNTITMTGPDGTRITQETFKPNESQPGEVTWSKETTTTNPDGTTETTTEESPDQDDPCKGREETLGCMNRGMVDDVEVPKVDVPVSITPQAFGPDNASCPQAPTISVAGIAVPFDYSLLCQYAAMLRPLVIALAWLLGGYILLGVRTSGDS